MTPNLYGPIIIVTLTASIFCMFSEPLRAKRVINGEPLLDIHVGYDVVRYYAWISNGHECDLPLPEFLKRWFGLRPNAEVRVPSFAIYCQPSPWNTKCGGALVTPVIVQTACHCLASYHKGSLETDPLKPEVRSFWESSMKVYLGVNSVDRMEAAVRGKRYFVHQKCSRLGVYPELLLYDYGFISLTVSLEEFDYPSRHPIRYAPLLTMEQLGKIWLYTVNKELVCLNVVFGVFKVDLFGEPTSEASAVLLHGWTRSVHYSRCSEVLGKAVTKPYSISKFNYSTDATWRCSLPLDPLEQSGGEGDSGGPITCNNKYFAISSNAYIGI